MDYIRLTKSEVEMVRFVARRRVSYNAQHSTRYTPYGWMASLPREKVEAFNYGAEFATAKFLNVFPEMSWDTWRHHDLVLPNGQTADVKCVPDPTHNLVVKNKSWNSFPDVFILVHGQVTLSADGKIESLNATYKVVGFALSSSVMSDVYLRNGDYPHWLYPAEYLQSPEVLLHLRKEPNP